MRSRDKRRAAQVYPSFHHRIHYKREGENRRRKGGARYARRRLTVGSTPSPEHPHTNPTWDPLVNLPEPPIGRSPRGHAKQGQGSRGSDDLTPEACGALLATPGGRSLVPRWIRSKLRCSCRRVYERTLPQFYFVVHPVFSAAGFSARHRLGRNTSHAYADCCYRCGLQTDGNALGLHLGPDTHGMNKIHPCPLRCGSSR